MKNNLLNKITLSAFGLLSFLIMTTSCGEDELDPNSIFTATSEVLDPNSESYPLDKYLQDNFQKVYNLQFRYKMQDVGADMNYNLVPTRYDNAINIAILNKHLWFDVYDKLAGPDFLKSYGPRILHLIGSPAYNPANHTMILGLAEGGLKVSLFRCNSIDPEDPIMLNEFYFKTMHHEFAHILHQTKTYPNEFNQISTAFYDPNGWQDRNDSVVTSLGFITTYASSENREDFAETIANYITKTDAQWNQILNSASKGWKQKIDINGQPVEVDGSVVYEPDNTDTDGIDGRAVILQKVSIAREWLKTAWNLDLDELRMEVQKRQNSLNIDELRKQEGFDAETQN